MRDYITKTYLLEIDFLDYIKNKDVTSKFIFNQNDTNTAFINAKLMANKEIIDLEPYDKVVVGIQKSDGYSVQSGCDIVDAKNGIVEIPFTTQSLASLGTNSFDITLYKKNTKLVSPKFRYIVEESMINDTTIESTNEYNSLVILVSQASNIVKTNDKMVSRIEGLENTAQISESKRQSNEQIRIKQETARQQSMSSIASNFNNKIVEIDNKINEAKNKLDSKVEAKFNEVDSSLSNKLTQTQTQVDDKVLEVTKKVDEINISKNSIVDTVDKKMVEVNMVKDNMQTKVKTSLSQFENRFQELEVSNPIGEVIQARITVDGSIKNSLKERLDYDFSKEFNTEHFHTEYAPVSHVDDSEVHINQAQRLNLEKILTIEQNISNIPRCISKNVAVESLLASDGLYKATIDHNLKCSSVDVKVYGTDKKERFVAIDVLNDSSFILWTDVREELNLVIYPLL